jgi:hypothetical protein
MLQLRHQSFKDTSRNRTLSLQHEPTPMPQSSTFGLLTRDGDDVVPLRQQPRQRQLRSRAPLLGSQLLDPARQAQVGLEGLALEARRAGAAEVLLADLVRAGEAPGQEAAAQGRVRQGSDAQLTHGGDELALQEVA